MERIGAWLGALLVIGSACAPGGDSSRVPAPPGFGRSTDRLVSVVADATGAQLTLAGSQGDSLTVVIPAGAVSEPTTFTLDEVSPNTSFGASGSAFRIGPQGVPLAKALRLVFIPAPATAVASVTTAYQDALGYWFRVYAVVRDPVERTVEAQTTRLGDWSLVTVATQRDLQGPVRLHSTQGVTFTAQGSLVLQYIGEYEDAFVYMPTGSLEVLPPLANGAATCTPDAPNPFPLHPNVAELRKAPADFRWGLGAQWTLTCDDGTRPFVSTNFDTLGITNPDCTRASVGTPVLDPVHVRGRYEIDCGAAGLVTAAWELVPPDQTPAPLP